MPRWLLNLIRWPETQAPKINRAKPGPSRREADRARILAKMRDMRYEMRMPFR